MANSACAVTQTRTEAQNGSRFSEVRWAWTSDDGAGVAGTVDFSNCTDVRTGTGSGGDSDRPYTGQVLTCITVPDAVDTPTNLYDLTILDGDGHDLLTGNGANRSDVNGEWCAGTVQALFNTTVVLSTLEITIAAAGNSKKGIVILRLSG